MGAARVIPESWFSRLVAVHSIGSFYGKGAMGRPRDLSLRPLIDGVPHKKCSSCSVIKPLTEFNKNVYSWDGYRGHCMSCERFRKNALDKHKRAKRNQRNRDYETALISRIEAGDITDKKLAEMRRAILVGDCIFCDRGGFQNIVYHVVRMHGLTGHEFRDFLFFTYKESICGKEMSQKYSERMNGEFIGVRNKYGTTPKMSLKGRSIISATERPWMTADWHAAGGRASGFSQRGKRKVPDIHGTRTHYMRGCRCELCKSANSTYSRVLRKRQAQA